MEGEDVVADPGAADVDTSTATTPDPAADTDTDTDTGGAPAATATTPAKSTLDELLATRPDWLKAQLGMLEGSKDITAEDVAGLDHNAQRVLAGFLKLAEERMPERTAKEQELSQKEQELAARERLLLHRQSGNLKLMNSPDARALLASLKPTGDAPDPYSDEGFEYRVNQKVHDAMEKFLGAFAKGEEDLKAAYAQAEAEASAAAQREAHVAYIDQHMDTFSDDRVADRVVELVTKHAHTIEDAHRIALREIVAHDEAETRKQAVELSRQRIQRGGRTGPVLPPTPEGSMMERLAFYKQYPEAQTRDYVKAFGRAPEES